MANKYATWIKNKMVKMRLSANEKTKNQTSKDGERESKKRVKINICEFFDGGAKKVERQREQRNKAFCCAQHKNHDEYSKYL